MEPSHITNKRRNASINIETFKTAEARKQSHFFTSESRKELSRKGAANDANIGPTTYDPQLAKDALLARKEFAKEIPKNPVAPVRDLSHQKSTLIQPEISVVPFVESKRSILDRQPQVKPYGINQLARDLVDPHGIKLTSHIQ